MITEPNEFIQRLQELQDSSSVTYSTLPSNEPRFIIDANSRTIKIPPEFQFLGVKNDHKAETVYFEIDRYFDDEDLSTHTCVVQFENKSGEGGIYPVTIMDTESIDGKIIFGWEILSDATTIVGDIIFSVRFYSLDNYVFTYNFNTLPAKSVILDTLNVDDPTVVENYPSELEAWLDRMNNLSQNVVKPEDVELLDTKMNTLETSFGELETNVNSSVAELKSDLDNIFDNVTNVVDASKIQNDKYYDNPNSIANASGWKCVRVDVKPNTTYSIWGINNGLSWFGASDNTGLGKITSCGNVTTPNGCTVLFLTSNSSRCISVIEGSDIPSSKIGYGILDVVIPKLVISASNIDITQNQQYLADRTEYSNYKNSVKESEYTNLSLFSHIGIVGDSFASGGIYGISGVTDNAYYNISWGSVLARRNGITSHIYASPGESTRTWLTNVSRGLTKALSEEFTGLYLLCLGINDTYISNYIGSIDDIKSDYTQNPDTFYGNYAKIYEQLKTHSPHSKFIFITPPESSSGGIVGATHSIANHYGVPYIDSYGGDDFFESEFYLNNHSQGHPTAVAYAGMAQAYERMITKCIRNNKNYFLDYCGE